MDTGFGDILDQDTDNLILQQEGLEASAKHGLTLGNYQEIRVRHFNQTIDKYMAHGAEDAGLEEVAAQVSRDLAGRTVLIAGASSGIGAHFARALVAAGAQVVLGARRFDRVAALAGELGDMAMPLLLDVTDEASVIAAYDAAEARFGAVNSVVANAGIGTGGRATEVPADGLRGVIETNLLGTMLVAREGARRMIADGSAARGDGRIVLIGSITAERAGMGDALYAATKAGLAHLGRNLAREWVRQGINVNCLQPGIIPTEANARVVRQCARGAGHCRAAPPPAAGRGRA